MGRAADAAALRRLRLPVAPARRATRTPPDCVAGERTERGCGPCPGGAEAARSPPLGAAPTLRRLALVVRTWNLYHGRTHPATRRTHLRRMLELVTADGPDVVALQEVPLWALDRLERWSGMASRVAVAVPALLAGPLARVLTELHAARLRSLVTGQANALLFGRRLEPGEQRLLQLNPEVGRWEWLRGGRQQRWCQAVDVRHDGRALVVANLHATNDPAAAPGEAARAAAFVGAAERAVLCGDFNAPRHALPGYSEPIEGIDQILVRGLELEQAPHAWEPGRRVLGGRLLSDHAPVEAVVR